MVLGKSHLTITRKEGVRSILNAVVGFVKNSKKDKITFNETEAREVASRALDLADENIIILERALAEFKQSIFFLRRDNFLREKGSIVDRDNYTEHEKVPLNLAESGLRAYDEALSKFNKELKRLKL